LNQHIELFPDEDFLTKEIAKLWYLLDQLLEINVVLPHLLGNYAKLIITWNLLDNLPISANNHLRAENLQNLFVHNQTGTNSSSATR